MSGVSPSLVSLHLKLVRRAPEIQIALRDLAAPEAVRHCSLRRMAALAGLDHEQQMAQFDALRRNMRRF